MSRRDERDGIIVMLLFLLVAGWLVNLVTGVVA